MNKAHVKKSSFKVINSETTSLKNRLVIMTTLFTKSKDERHTENPIKYHGVTNCCKIFHPAALQVIIKHLYTRDVTSFATKLTHSQPQLVPRRRSGN